GAGYADGFPIENPEGVSWDMAFVLAAFCVPTDPPDPEEPVAVEKNRYLSFVPQNPGQQTALRVTLVNMPPPFEDYEGCQLWVGQPSPVSEAAASTGPTPPPTFMAAELQNAWHCMDWSTVGLLDVFDDEVVPGALYDVQAIGCACDPSNPAHYSAPLSIATSKWGDVVGAYYTNPANCMVMPSGYVDCWSPPNGVVNFDDISSLVDKFRNLFGAPRKARADIAPDIPDRLVNFVDVSYDVDAFRGLPYPFDGPDECPEPGPQIGEYSNSGCLPQRAGDEYEPCIEDDEIELAVEPGTLHVLHRNATYNCCIEEIAVSLSVEGSVLKLTEEEILEGGGCDCMCCYNLEASVVNLEPGEYTVVYCWDDYETGGQQCHVEDIVIPEAPPRIGGYSNSGCLDKSGGDRSQCGEDEIELTPGPGTLDVVHRNALYNCCPDDIVISLSVEGAVLRLTEEEILTDGCFCVCCFDVQATVLNLEPGEYTVEFCWYDYDSSEEECYVQDIVIP
ncbi:MAG: hypothetical protein WBE26_16600, partial [Phycisphaerae bacterium]